MALLNVVLILCLTVWTFMTDTVIRNCSSAVWNSPPVLKPSYFLNAKRPRIFLRDLSFNKDCNVSRNPVIVNYHLWQDLIIPYLKCSFHLSMNFCRYHAKPTHIPWSVMSFNRQNRNPTVHLSMSLTNDSLYVCVIDCLAVPALKPGLSFPVFPWFVQPALFSCLFSFIPTPPISVSPLLQCTVSAGVLFVGGAPPLPFRVLAIFVGTPLRHLSCLKNISIEQALSPVKRIFMYDIIGTTFSILLM